MAKNPIVLAPDLTPDRRKSKMLPIASIFVLAPLLAPVIMETVSICHGQWCEVMGRSVTVRTPFLDSIGEQIEEVREVCWYHLLSRFQRVPWNPKVVLPVMAVIMALAMFMMRF